MPQGVTLFTLEINSVPYQFIGSVTIGERVLTKQTEYIGITGFSNQTPRETFSIDRIRTFGDTIEFDGIVNGTLTMEFETGDRLTYTGVHTMTEGAETADGLTEMTSTIDFGASGRIKN